MPPPTKRLSIVIPARNEELNISGTVEALYRSLVQARINHEIIVVDDGSTDGTASILVSLAKSIPTLIPLHNPGPHGFGLAIDFGLRQTQGDAVAIMMADACDDPEDLVQFFRVYEQGQFDCVFGTRFSGAGSVTGYPIFKLVLNRIVNTAIRILFGLRYNDITNAFKLYSTSTIQGLRPLISPHYNLAVELPLKAIGRGYSYPVLPNRWYVRKHGKSGLRIKEMGSRYLFIILYCFIEKWLSCGDYTRRDDKAPRASELLPISRP